MKIFVYSFLLKLRFSYINTNRVFFKLMFGISFQILKQKYTLFTVQLLWVQMSFSYNRAFVFKFCNLIYMWAVFSTINRHKLDYKQPYCLTRLYKNHKNWKMNFIHKFIGELWGGIVYTIAPLYSPIINSL